MAPADLTGELAAADPHAPVVAFLRIAAGDLRAGLHLAEEVVGQRAETAERTADVLVLRMWVAGVGRQCDHAALAEAEELLTGSPRLQPGRRALLHLNVAAALQENLTSAEASSTERIEVHLAAARDLAQLAGLDRVTVAAYSRLALMSMLHGQVPSAMHHAAAARRVRGRVLGERLEAWEQRVIAVEQWALHCRNQPADEALLERLMCELDGARRSALTCAVAASATSLAIIDRGDVSATRQLIDRVLGDPYVRTAGVWLLMLLLLDGYLAISSGDRRRRASACEALRRVGAEAEARILEATELARSEQYPRVVEVLAPVTEGLLPTLSLTYPSACVLEAVVHLRLGSPAAARASLARAVADTQRTGVLRPFTIPEHRAVRELLTGLAADNPATAQWIDQVVGAVELAGASPVNRTTAVPLPAEGRAGPVSPLTGREREILELVAEGLDQGAIARRLFLSINTVKTHLRSARRKAGADRSAEAVLIARAAGWIRTGPLPPG